MIEAPDKVGGVAKYMVKESIITKDRSARSNGKFQTDLGRTHSNGFRRPLQACRN